MSTYHVRKIPEPVDIAADWDSPGWKNVETIRINRFRPEGSDHHPVVACRLQHDGRGFYGLFQVRDNYIRSVATEHNSSVCQDSCVEFFVEPPGRQGYLNFEFNCGGTMLIYHVVDCTRTETGFKEWSPVSESEAASVRVFHTMPKVVDPESTVEQTWRLGFFIPFTLFESRIKGLKADSGVTWRGNFYKCGDDTSHPHWASWNPVSALNFHLPECFGDIVLG